jgi:hypothetical protein
VADDDDGSLPLTDRQRSLLQELQRSIEQRSGDRGTRAGSPIPALRDLRADLPPCPLGAPPKPITTQLDAGSGDLYLRCLHTTADPGPHCWDLTGKRRGTCP